MQSSTHKAESLVELGLVVGLLVRAAQANALAEELANMLSRGHDASVLVGNVVLHAGLLVNGELDTLIDGATKAAVVVAGVDVVGIVLGVVDMVLGAVAAQAVGGDFKLAATIAKGQETEDAEKEADGFGGNGLDGTDIDGLGVVAEPVAKVNAGNGELVESLAAHGAGHGDLEEGICDITVAPCFPVSLISTITVTANVSGWVWNVQFWPSILDIPAMLPAPKARAGLANR